MIEDQLRTYFETTPSRLPPIGLLARSAPGQSNSSIRERVEIVRGRLAEDNPASRLLPGPKATSSPPPGERNPSTGGPDDNPTVRNANVRSGEVRHRGSMADAG